MKDPTQILLLGLDNQTILYKFYEWRRDSMEDDVKTLKVEYLSNRL